MGFLPDDQKQAFLAQLQSQGGGPGVEISPEQQQAAIDAGAQQAQADTQGQPADAGAPAAPQQPAAPEAPAQPQVDPSAEALASVGFQSVDELIQAFVQQGQAASQMQTQLRQLAGLQKAMENTDELDPKDPQYELRKAIRETIGPLAEEMTAQARNRAVQGAWAEAAKGFPDIGEMDKDIAAYLAENPDLSIDPSGLQQAYHAVRSKKYIPEGKMLEDPKFIEKAAANPAIRDAVIKSYLSALQRGDAVPPSVGGGGGGSVPLTGPKEGPKTMDDAKSRMKAFLGVK